MTKEKKQRFCLLLTLILTTSANKSRYNFMSFFKKKKKKTIKVKAIKNTQKHLSSTYKMECAPLPVHVNFLCSSKWDYSIACKYHSLWALCNQLSNNAYFDCFPSLAIHHIQWWVCIYVYLHTPQFVTVE